MDAIQEQHERAVGDCFIAFYNREHISRYEYYGRGGIAPDLVYRDGTSELGIEITDAYYDSADAKARWKQARDKVDAPDGWSWRKGGNIDRALAEKVARRIKAKSHCAYDGKCVLLVNVHPALTTASEFEEHMSELQVPVVHSFGGTYLVGHFPCCSTSAILGATAVGGWFRMGAPPWRFTRTMLKEGLEWIGTRKLC